MTDRERIDQLELSVRELRRQNLEILRLTTRNGCLSQKLAIDYCEEAVASVFGLDRNDFYFYKDRKKKQGRHTSEKEPVRLAMYTLFNLLHKIFRRPGREIMRHYCYTDFQKWKDIDFDLDLMDFDEISKWAGSVKEVHLLMQEDADNGQLINSFHVKTLEYLTELLHSSELFKEIEWFESSEA